MQEVLISARRWPRVIILAAAYMLGSTLAADTSIASVSNVVLQDSAAPAMEAVTGTEIKCENGKAYPEE